VSKYRLVVAEKACFPINMMCRLLEISRSAYYAWVDRPASARAVRTQALGERIVALHADSDGTYGSPRLLIDLRAEGVVVSGKTVAKVMQDKGTRGCAPRPWRLRTVPEPDPSNIPQDRVKRQFDQGRLDAVWVGDITYLRTWTGWLYLATVIDAHSRRVIGWALAEHMRASLVTDALSMAVVQRGYPVAGVIFHSDRGVPIHLGCPEGPGEPARAAAVGRPDRGVLGQRDGRVVLRDVEERADLPPPLADPGQNPRRSQHLDPRALQPATTALSPRHEHAARVREHRTAHCRSGSVTRVHLPG